MIWQSIEGTVVRIIDGDSVKLLTSNGDPEELSVGDSVLVRMKRNDYLRLIKAMNQGRFIIGNNRGGVNGWVGHNCIYGIATKVE